MDNDTTRFTQREDWLPHREMPGATYHLRTSTLAEFAGTLARPEIARTVTNALHHDNERRYTLYAYAVMPDHFHALLRPLPRGKGFVPVPEIMQAIKSVTARRINRALGRRGSFWRDEYFNRIMRSAREHNDTVHYIWCNPVKAGPVSHPDEWPWVWVRR